MDTVAEDRRLMDVFNHADIDDITFNTDADVSEQVEVVFTERVTGDAHQVAASTLADALHEARLVIEDRQAFRQLRAAGFSGSDIADLVGNPSLAALDDEFDQTPEGDAWRRGYEAGVMETGELYADAFARRVSADPAFAAVGEPVEQRELPAIRIIPIDGAYVALVMPTTVIHD